MDDSVIGTLLNMFRKTWEWETTFFQYKTHNLSVQIKFLAKNITSKLDILENLNQRVS